MDVVSTNMDIDVTMGRAACAAVIIALIIRKRQRRRKRSIWVREWIRRRHNGAYHHLMRELERVQAMDVSSYLNFVRMNASTFETLLTKVAPLIARKDTNMRDAIPPGECLAVTLRFLATGENKRPACM